MGCSHFMGYYALCIIHQTQQRAKGKIVVQSLEMLVGHLKRPEQGLLSPAVFKVAEVLR